MTNKKKTVDLSELLRWVKADYLQKKCEETKENENIVKGKPI